MKSKIIVKAKYSLLIKCYPVPPCSNLAGLSIPPVYQEYLTLI